MISMDLGTKLVPGIVTCWSATQDTTDFRYRPSQTTVDAKRSNGTTLFTSPDTQRLRLPVQMVGSSRGINSSADFEIDGDDVVEIGHAGLRTLV